MRWAIAFGLAGAGVLAVETTVVVALIGVAGVLVTAMGGWFVARRSSSGDVRQTSPDKLWDVADGMRRELADALEKAYAREERLRDRITEQDERLAEQDRRLATQDRRIHELEAEVLRLSKGIPG